MLERKEEGQFQKCVPLQIPCGGFKNWEDFDEKTEAAAYVQVKKCQILCNDTAVVEKITHVVTGREFMMILKKYGFLII